VQKIYKKWLLSNLIMGKAIKISEENYRWLMDIASKLQKKSGKVMTLNDSINEIKKYYLLKKSIIGLSGKWKMKESESNKIKEEIKLGWSKWQKEFV